jgi:peptide-methionine (R)-S-oxide reductase
MRFFYLELIELKKANKEWKKELTKEQYHILREKGTERPFTGIYWNHFEKGIYKCAGCGMPLFSSETKFDSSCGWPSFSTPLEEDKIKEERDLSHGMVRIEVLCQNCGGHLGHVFNDGPEDRGGLRYCINSISLDFNEK